MNRWLFASSGAYLLLAAAAGLLGARAPQRAGEEAGQSGGAGPRVVARAVELLDSLDEKQRGKALLGFESQDRFDWHFIPRERKGLALAELDPPRRERVVALLKAALSPEGARLAEEVMGLEDVLAKIEGPGRRIPRDPLLYSLIFFGRPGAGRGGGTGRWGFRFEGHHLSLNFTLDGERILSATPLFYGANPALVPEGPRKGLRILSGLEDLAREVVNGLPEADRKACLGEEGGEVPQEVPHGGSAYAGPLPRGISGERLTPELRRTLGRLIQEYTRNLPADLIPQLGEEELKRTHLAWRGGLKAFEPHSYLVHGPGFVINYTNVQNGAAHVHSCLRRLQGEFGLAPRS